jgi:hypothetical protein
MSSENSWLAFVWLLELSSTKLVGKWMDSLKIVLR